MMHLEPAPPAPRRERIRRRSWFRTLLPAVLILVWLTGASFGGPLFGKIDEVSSNDRTTYLPESADATKVQELLGEFRESDAIPAIVVFTSDEELDGSRLNAIDAAVAALADNRGVDDGVSPALPSVDGRAVQVFVPISSDADIGDVSSELSAELRAAAPKDVKVFITGPA